MNMDGLCAAVIMLLAVAGLAGCAPAASPGTSTGAAAPAPAAQPPAASTAEPGSPATAARPEPARGVRVYLDPVSGEAREPTRAEAAAAASGRVQREAAGGQAVSEGASRERVVLPDGTEGVKLAPRDRHSVVVCRQADGSFSGECPSTSTGSTP